MKIYHNNRCSKSRQCLALLPIEGVEIIDYIKNPLNKLELNALINKLGIKPLDLVRKNEVEWRENYTKGTLSDEEILDALILYPKLIERPIVETIDKAIICRPPELVLALLNV